MKVFLIIGLCNENVTISNYGVKSTIDEARKELQEIKKEILQESEKNELKVEIIEDKNSLEAVYDNGDSEKYYIFERIIDYK